MAAVSNSLRRQIEKLEAQFTVDDEKLKAISRHFVGELEKGLSKEGGSLPMNPTWIVSLPDGNEQGTYITLEIGGTNVRVHQITLTGRTSQFDRISSEWGIPKDIKSADADTFWDFVAGCLDKFLEQHPDAREKKLPLSLIFSYPVTQDHINAGILQRWTKGFNVSGVEGQDVVPMFREALMRRQIPVTLEVLTNDTTATLIASAYADPRTRIGCIFGTGCNAAYMEDCGSIPKLAHLRLPPDMPMAINCEWGAFDNERKVLPRTPYDVTIDDTSPRPGQQVFEKMVAGLYLGEIFRLVLLDFHDNRAVGIFEGQDVSKLREPYSLDSSILSLVAKDESKDHREIRHFFQSKLGLTCRDAELELVRRASTVILMRAARLVACGIAAICTKKGYESCRVGAEGSLIEKHPRFRGVLTQSLRRILDWPDKKNPNDEDPVEIIISGGSGLGAAVVAELTLRRIREGNTYGVLQVAQS
ncbi:hypothetical protein VTK73DRAFT_5578 [Phialemonium thermophilum]|uniref:Phosphotransferase n=1 Tax=Phialemonium thermophilum TaxID=223376 RepID=A0ABR3XY25_9PEZI